MTPELEQEGLAREVINRIQRMRKEADFAVEERIFIRMETPSPELQAAWDTHQALIGEETLSESVSEAKDSWHSATLQVDEHSLILALGRQTTAE